MMAGIKALVLLAFGGSIGMTFVILGCALPAYKVWWPFFVVLFYILVPVPIMIARHYTNNFNNLENVSNNSCLELAVFITTGIVISSFALPIVLARSPVNDPMIQWGACYLTFAGNIIIYLTLVGFLVAFDQDEFDYGTC